MSRAGLPLCLAAAALLAWAGSGALACGTLTASDGPDATTAETPPTLDEAGSVDAGDAAPGAFCESVDATFCRDFDNGTDPLAGFSGESFDKAPPTIDPLSVTPPGALHITIPATLAAATSNGHAFLERTFLVGWRSMRLDFDVWLEPPAWTPTSTSVAFATIYVDHGAVSYTFSLALSEKSLNLALQMPNPTTDVRRTAAPLPVGKWVHVRLEVDPPAPTTGAVRLSLDNGPNLLPDTSYTIPAATTTESVALRIGIQDFNHPTPAFDIHYDDVVFDVP